MPRHIVTFTSTPLGHLIADCRCAWRCTGERADVVEAAEGHGWLHRGNSLVEFSGLPIQSNTTQVLRGEL